MKWGGQEKHIVIAAVESGQDLPAPLQNRPEVWPHCLQYWRAFWILSPSRDVALGYGASMPQPISFADLCLYADRYEINGMDFDLFVMIIQRMDTAFRSEIGKQAKGAQQWNQPGPGGSTRLPPKQITG